MATFYGTLQGARGEATRCGSRQSGIHAAAQSWDGSVAVTLYEEDGETMARILAGRGSTSHPFGRTVYAGPLRDLIEGQDR